MEVRSCVGGGRGGGGGQLFCTGGVDEGVLPSKLSRQNYQVQKMDFSRLNALWRSVGCATYPLPRLPEKLLWDSTRFKLTSCFPLPYPHNRMFGNINHESAL